jgi:O-methyltransferase involved in polyketide biosynthesis
LETTGKIHLSEEKETLFITLYAKALDYRSKHSILNDKTADYLLKTIDFDVRKYKGFGNIIIVIRAKQFDEWIKEFIKENVNALVVYLGCGLDTRVTRINPSSQISWFDIDYPEVIKLRKTYYSDRDGYKMIESSVTDPNWFAQIPSDKPTLIVAEGILEYLTSEQVKILLTRLTDHFTHGQIMFDVMNSFAINAGKEKLKETTGAVHKWAVDDASEVDKLNPKLTRIIELPLFKSQFIRRLPFGLQLLLGFASFFANYRNMIRLMRYHF